MGQSRILYRTEVTAVEDGRSGRVLAANGREVVRLVRPEELGGPGGEGSNPEELFASAYSACFHSALKSVARQRKLPVDGSSVTAVVALAKQTSGSYGLEVELKVSVPTLAREAAEELMHAAHRTCPYSSLMRQGGRVEVSLVEVEAGA